MKISSDYTLSGDFALHQAGLSDSLASLQAIDKGFLLQMADSDNGYTTKNTGFKRFYHASIYSWQGLKAAYAQEPAFRYEVWGSAVLIPLAFFVAQSPMQLAALISTCLLVLAFELVNTAIEAVVDRAGTEFHELAGLAKDLGSAVVMVSLGIGALIWWAVLWTNFA